MLDKIKLLLGLTNDDKDELLSALITLCKDEAADYCHFAEYSNKLDSAVISMVIERYNKLGEEGIQQISSSSVTDVYIDGYSQVVMKKLNANRRVRFI